MLLFWRSRLREPNVATAEARSIENTTHPPPKGLACRLQIYTKKLKVVAVEPNFFRTEAKKDNRDNKDNSINEE